MPNIKEEINAINQIYVHSCDRKALREAEKRLFVLLDNPLIDDNNRQNSEALIIKLSCKRAAILYFLEGYCKSDYDKLIAFANKALQEANEKGYKHTAEVIKILVNAATSVNAIMVDAAHYFDTIRNEKGDCIAVSAEDCEEVAQIFERKLCSAKELQVDPVLGTGVEFPSVKESVLKDINEVLAFAALNAEKIKYADIERLYDSIVTEPDKTLSSYMYRPTAAIDVTKANTLILCTPFKDEGELFAITNCALRKKELIVINAGVFAAVSSKKLDALFTLLLKKDNSILVKGLNKYFSSNKDEVIKFFISLGKKGKKIFILDSSSQREIYEKAQELVKDSSYFSILDISFMYLSVPQYDNIREEFSTRNMGKNAIAALHDNRAEIMYAGYIGFNKAFNAFAGCRDWLKVLKAESKHNEASAIKYLSGLPSQLPLVDYGWGDLISLTAKNKRNDRTPFDYDSIKELSAENVRVILEGDYGICEKCGLIARYATLHGADKSEWASLSDEEYEKRLYDAVNLIYYVLEIPFTAQVVIEKLPGRIGGLCCDGGKLIKFDKKCVKGDPEYIATAICHECHHSLQHEATSGAWKDWYWSELGITKGRLFTWKQNLDHYVSTYNDEEYFYHYYVQAVECESRAFEKECMDAAQRVWSKLKVVN